MIAKDINLFLFIFCLYQLYLTIRMRRGNNIKNDHLYIEPCALGAQMAVLEKSFVINVHKFHLGRFLVENGQKTLFAFFLYFIILHIFCIIL